MRSAHEAQVMPSTSKVIWSVMEAVRPAQPWAGTS